MGIILGILVEICLPFVYFILTWIINFLNNYQQWYIKLKNLFSKIQWLFNHVWIGNILFFFSELNAWLLKDIFILQFTGYLLEWKKIKWFLNCQTKKPHLSLCWKTKCGTSIIKPLEVIIALKKGSLLF